MQIKQRLRLNAVVMALSAFAVIAVLLVTMHRAMRAMENDRIADGIITASFERGTLRADYLRTGSDRAKEQVSAKHREIAELLTVASEKFTDPEDRETIAALMKGHESIGKNFRAIVENRRESASLGRSASVSRESEDRFLSQLNMRVYEAALLGRKLQESSSAALVSALRLAGGGIAFVFLLVSSLTLANSWMTGRAITDRITRLRDGAAVIGEGDLNHRIGLKGDDEFAELSAAFDAMTKKLHLSYSNLEKEITERRRAESVMKARFRMLEAAYTGETSVDEALQLTLDEIESQTGSKIGFYHFLEADQETLSLRRWSTNTVSSMCTAEGAGSHYNISQAGVWVDCVRERKPVIHNDYASLPHRKGMPPGHAPVIREMVIPIMRGERIVAVIGVGNKPTDYTATDIEIATLLGDFSWEILERKRAEEEVRRAEREREVSLEFLHIVNESIGTHDLIKSAATFFQEQSGCEAVGIRLKEGDDYPYYEARGFPKDFIQVEGSLCSCDESGNVIKDEWGNPILACMCGNIICGRFDPEKQFFSKGGSFWTNSTTELLGSTTDADRQTRTRNRCNGEGYESVALAPLYIGAERLGLIQLNDRRKGMFTPEGIAHWERLAGYLAVALAKSRSEEALRVSEEKLSLALRAADMGIWRMDLSEQKRYFDDQTCRCLGIDPAYFRGTTEEFYAAVHPDDREGITAALNRTIRSGTPYEVEYRAVWPDGRIRHIAARGRLARDTAGQPRWIDGLAWDITERRKAEEEIRHLASFPSLNPNPICEVDSSGNVTFCNPAAGKTLEDIGLDRGEVAVFMPADMADILRLLERAEEATFYREVTVQDRVMGETIHLAPQFDVARIYALDITERKKAEREILRLSEEMAARNVELEAANRELEGFSYSVSHDLRAPLRHMTGFADLLERRSRAELDETSLHYVSVISQAAKKMGVLIDDLLAFSRIGRAEVRMKRVGLTALVKEVIQEVHAEVKGRDIAWKIGELSDTYGDPSMLKLVLANLVSNAVKFSQRRAQAEIEIGCREEKEEVVFFVKDNGVGFDMKYADQLFGVFQRLHPREEFEGTGIGLANVRRIIARHGGRTWAEGSPGEGATVYFALPKTKED
ncbi:MAG TPA: GAF domain-containing protein [Thermodesulfovibrionales bacterium]|nr:GAF domain-containing protein [Thermodesulfovibrionales bacterium]